MIKFIVFLSCAFIQVTWSLKNLSSCSSHRDQPSDNIGLSHLMIGGGLTRWFGEVAHSQTVEVIQFSLNKTKCNQLPKFVESLNGAIAFENELDNNNIHICGGFHQSTTSNCFKLVDGNWVQGTSMLEPRRYAASANIPGVGVIVIGGEVFPNSLSSTEMLVKDIWQSSTPLSQPISRHCVVSIDQTSILIIGGFVGTEHFSSKVFDFTWNGVDWAETKKKTLMTGREFHSCAMINANHKLDSNRVIIAGGKNRNILDSVEVFNTNNEIWFEGPTLPVPLYFSTLVQDPDGGVLLVGGHNGQTPIDEIYILKDLQKHTQWEKLEQKLLEPRWSHIALLIPDNLVECFPVYTKAAVAQGSSNGILLQNVEVIDLSNPKTICENLPDLPYGNTDAAGGLGFNDNPVICGGEPRDTSACHLFENGQWKSIDGSMNEGRYAFAITKSPFPGDSKLFAFGGNRWNSPSGSLKTSEHLTLGGWQQSVPLYVEIFDHCMVAINSNSVMVISGYQGNKPSRSAKTFIFSSVTNSWSEGPPLNQPRNDHSCSIIRKNSRSHDKSIIVLGGFNKIINTDTLLTSVEVLDMDSSEWRAGPSLPVAIAATAIVEDPSGGIVVISGFAGKYEDGNEIGLDTLYRLAHAGVDAEWEVMSQKLKTPRFDHTAFLIPDGMTDCEDI